MVPHGIPVVSLLLGAMALLALSPFAGPSVWVRGGVVVAVVVLSYVAVLVSIRRLRRSSAMGRALVTAGFLVVPALVVTLAVLPQVTDVSTNVLVGPAAVLATTVVFRLVHALGEVVSPKSPVNLVAGVVGAFGYLMALPTAAAVDVPIWGALGLAAAAGVLVGGFASWLLAGAQYWFP